MFSSAKSQINKMMSMMPNNEDMMTLAEYNQYYKQMIKLQTDSSGNDLPRKVELEDNHRKIVSNVLTLKLTDMKSSRTKK